MDLDAFYASVEQLHDPRLRGRPVVVGGLGPRGVVAAASYEARRFGVQSAMPMARARRACPDGVFLAPRFDAYRVASRMVMAILESYTPLVEPLALDEAFLDVHGVRRLHGPAPAIARALRRRVREETGLVASVGVATTKLMAKLASETAKPDGLLVVEAGAELELLHRLPVRRLWGVGAATAARLSDLGVRTVGDLAAVPEATLVGALGPAAGARLHALAWNRDDRAVEVDRPTKSIGHEETFARDVDDEAALERVVLAQAERVATRLRRCGLLARTVVLKARAADFTTLTRSRTLPEPTDLAAEIAATAVELLRGLRIGSGRLRDGVRLVGVAVQQLGTGRIVQAELDLGETDADLPVRAGRPGRRALEEAVDRARARYGDAAVVPARLASR